MTSARKNKQNYGLTPFDSPGPRGNMAWGFMLKKKMKSMWYPQTGAPR